MRPWPAVRYRRTAFAGLLVLFVAAAGVQAAEISVRPLGLTLTAEQPVRTFTVANPGADPVTVQIEALAWSQPEDTDALTSTRELLITPPIVEIPPSESQLVRVGLRREPEPDRELAYRVRFSEVPPPPEPGFTGLVVALQISVPVFVSPPGATAPEAHWNARMNDNGGLELTVANRGNAHLKVTEVAVSGGGEQIGGGKKLVYVLPGSSQSFTVPVERVVSSGTSLQVEARTPDGVRSFQASVD